MKPTKWCFNLVAVFYIGYIGRRVWTSGFLSCYIIEVFDRNREVLIILRLWLQFWKTHDLFHRMAILLSPRRLFLSFVIAKSICDTSYYGWLRWSVLLWESIKNCTCKSQMRCVWCHWQAWRYRRGMATMRLVH